MARLIISLVLVVLAGLAQAQGAYPARPIRLVYPYPAGGTGDSVMRIVADMLGPELGGSVIIDNRPGAAGVIGTKHVAGSAPDGYTLGLSSNGTHAAVLSLWKNPGYDPLKDFTHIGLFATLPWMLVTARDQPFQSASDLVAFARANPGKLTMPYYSSSSRVLVYLLESAGKAQVTEIPYKGPEQILQGLYDGQLQAAFFPMEIALAQAAGGRMRVLGAAADKRLPGAPDVPAIAEQLPGVALTSWMGLAAPAGLPADVTAKLRAALTRVVNKPEFRQRLQKISADALAETPEQIDRRIRDEELLWSRFVKAAGIQPE